MYKELLFFSFMLLLFTGCHDNIVEELGLIKTVGYDQVKSTGGDEELLVTISFPLTKGEQIQRQTITSIAESSKEARILLSRQTDKKLVSGQLRSILIGEELARKGIWEIIDSLNRDPNIRPRTKITIVKGNANDLLTKRYPYYPQLDDAITSLLEKEAMLNSIPEVDMHRFSKNYLDNGIDPIAPIITIGKEGMISEGVALFKKDQFKATINIFQSQILFLILGEFQMGDLSIKLDREKLLFSFLSSKNRINVNVDSTDKIKVTLNVDVQGYITEYVGHRDLSKVNEIIDLEKEIATYLEQKANSIISIMKEEKMDNLGIGKHIRNKMTVENWEKVNWPDSIANVDVQPRIKVKIMDTGLIQ
ncbi:Ger(x)C family spore germination protein [Alkalihalobacterium alkalinitrilicum]|uniref:Ger(x)C family spore germination protein n=1 Tax=Alkalihalobacterium alkalinitrilicum TaxID=427920 RepID=UPI0009955C66|nr:Ger(x)C family spore germination protein [Alkalihalobacterium alkalinitrilicum]